MEYRCFGWFVEKENAFGGLAFLVRRERGCMVWVGDGWGCEG